jgi:predicted polyphosphate/ATP-dependent NAD kinase
MTRIIVCGGRKYRDSGRVYTALEEYVDQDPVIVHGDCPGADRLADREARDLGLTVEPHPADWSQGPKAGPIRNQKMIDAGADLVIAFAGGTGTADCVRRARKAGIPVREEP